MEVGRGLGIGRHRWRGPPALWLGLLSRCGWLARLPVREHGDEVHCRGPALAHTDQQRLRLVAALRRDREHDGAVFLHSWRRLQPFSADIQCHHPAAGEGNPMPGDDQARRQVDILSHQEGLSFPDQPVCLECAPRRSAWPPDLRPLRPVWVTHLVLPCPPRPQALPGRAATMPPGLRSRDPPCPMSSSGTRCRTAPIGDGSTHTAGAILPLWVGLMDGMTKAFAPPRNANAQTVRTSYHTAGRRVRWGRDNGETCGRGCGCAVTSRGRDSLRRWGQ